MKLKFLFLLLISQFGFSQIWVNSLDEAKKVAKTTNKFILLDFNASWCKPCKKMETDFWYNTAYKSTLDKFIIVPIDIDTNRDVAQNYNVSSIPDVKLVDINGDVIHQTLGFQNSKYFDQEFNGFPEGTEDLYTSLNFKDKKNPTDEELITLATSYQVLLQKSENTARNKFLTLSNNFFNKCIKKTSDAKNKEISELGKFFNLALTNSENKVVKNLDTSKISEENKSYAHYILAKAYYQTSNKNEAEKNIAEIEKINDENWVYAAKTLKAKYK
ncbi:thioredoxin family protein [Chryseobacterium populi]|uniref:Thioredoxin domain-containing protein n=1 Tax=Chryseobacterium populi TaxID=1144316 RepID=J3CN84_9FLAO|nr:thioredoxin family protein [Chryseobacterium populi]EJL75099.1 thioredoxin domain-containing protein [Chryseobacterium populi]